MPKLTRDEVLELVTVEAAYSKASAALEKAKDDRAAVRDRLLSRLPVGEWITLFGVRLRHRHGNTGEKFSLKRMRGAGKKLPKYLEPFVSPPRTTELLDLEPDGDQATELEHLAQRVATVVS